MDDKLIVLGESVCEEVNENWNINRDDEDDLRVPVALFWSVEDAANFMKDNGFPQYMNAIYANRIDGKRLIFMEASNLVKMGIKDFDHIKAITAAVRERLTIEDPDYGRRIYLPPRNKMGMYLELKAHSGRKSDKSSYAIFTDETEGKIWQSPLTNEGMFSSYAATGCNTMYPV